MKNRVLVRGLTTLLLSCASMRVRAEWFPVYMKTLADAHASLKPEAPLMELEVLDLSKPVAFRIPVRHQKRVELRMKKAKGPFGSVLVKDLALVDAAGVSRQLPYQRNEKDRNPFQDVVQDSDGFLRVPNGHKPNEVLFKNTLRLELTLEGTEQAITGTLEFLSPRKEASLTLIGLSETGMAQERREDELSTEIQRRLLDTFPSVDHQEEMAYLLPETKKWFLLEDPVPKMAKAIQLSKDSDGAAIQAALTKRVADQRLSRDRQYLNDIALERSIRNLMKSFPATYPMGDAFLAELDALSLEAETAETQQRRLRLHQRALVEENPLLKGKQLLAVRRRDLGERWKSDWAEDYPANWQGLTSIGERETRSEIVLMSVDQADPAQDQVLYRSNFWVGQVDLHFDAGKFLFTSIQAKDEDPANWRVYEYAMGTGTVTPLTGHMPPDTDSYDACYTASDDRVLFVNSSGYQGVPCVGGKDYVGNLHLLQRDTGETRRLCFDQDNNWHPSLLPNGRVMFLRWEYTDSSHYFSRVLMHMNPDGTDQKQMYGSQSYWPNSLFYARPVPGSSSKFFGIVSGHHGVRQAGELYLFDVEKGRKEATGVVQQVPGYEKPIAAPVRDALVNGTSLRFAEPFPLNEDYVLVTREGGGLYLVDVFDNVVPIRQSEVYSYVEPIVFESTARPKIVPDRTRPGAPDATAFIADVYEGPGLQGVPPGTVKSMRVYRYEYSPRNQGGHYSMGMESGWDVKILLGTVPVEEDGSAMFKIPANAPLALQPLDEDGQAMQLMRSWFTAMPGEVVSCIGCHEDQNQAPPVTAALAARREPSQIQSSLEGGARGIGFLRDVQPVLDRHCIGCHGADETQPPAAGLNLVHKRFVNINSGRSDGSASPGNYSFGNSYLALHPYVRRNGPEGDYSGLVPLEFHADTSLLIQRLKKGHHGVELPPEAMQSLVQWIDLNTPFHDHWANAERMERRYELREQYAGDAGNYEDINAAYKYERTDVFQKPVQDKNQQALILQEFPWGMDDPRLDPAEIETSELDVAEGVMLPLVKIPEGRFPMGSVKETPAEAPMSAVDISKPFWMGVTEVSLRQYQLFDPEHKNGVYDMHAKDQVNRGYFMDTSPDLPVIRVSWERAQAYCDWLSQKTGRKVSLPTEAQWEWAARAGQGTPLFWGDRDADFSKYANLADRTIEQLAVRGANPRPIPNPNPWYDFVPKIDSVNDGVLHLAPVQKYEANPFGFKNINGNVAEWTRSVYRPYPYVDTDGRNDTALTGEQRVVRGGSWRDKPKYATATWRWRYPQWQSVYNVGFRVVIED